MLSIKLKKQLDNFALDLEMDIDSGITVLCGPSATGKTTLLRCLTGLLEPDTAFIQSGEEVWIDTDRNFSLPAHKRNAGLVFQKDTLFPHLTVKDNLSYSLNLKDKADQKLFNELVGSFQLEKLLIRKTCNLSGGERQRIALARTLAKKPDVLLLDEPFASLDYPVKTEMLSLLKDVSKTHNIPILYITHDLYELVSLAERTFFLFEGTIVASGNRLEIFENPIHPEVSKLAPYISKFKL